MNGYAAFLKKELTENLKNYRFMILFAVFLVFGLSSPLLAKSMPEILSAVAADMRMGTDPVALDAWEQFFKNISGVGFSAFIILFGSCMSSEYSKGTLVLLVTKGLPRWAVILAKYTVAAILMTVCYWTGFLAAYCYTGYLWPGVALCHVLTAAFYLWLIGFLYLSILLLGCVLFKQTFTSILFTGGVVALISLLGIAPPLAQFNPFLLTSKNVDLISGVASGSEFFGPAVISVAITVVGLWSAILFFDRRQL